MNNKIFKKNPDIVTRVIEDETILLPLYKTSRDIDCIYTLNDAGARAWQLIDGERTLAKIKEMILNEFDATAKEVDRELAVFLQELQEIKSIA